jgi:hypothetical protein
MLNECSTLLHANETDEGTITLLAEEAHELQHGFPQWCSRSKEGERPVLDEQDLAEHRWFHLPDGANQVDEREVLQRREQVGHDGAGPEVIVDALVESQGVREIHVFAASGAGPGARPTGMELDLRLVAPARALRDPPRPALLSRQPFPKKQPLERSL